MSGLILKTAGGGAVLIALALASAGELTRLIEMQEAVPERAAVAAPAPTSSSMPSHGTDGPFSVVLTAGRGGHFFAEPSVNGVRIPMMVDTGASYVSLSFEHASRLGIRPLPSDFKIRMSTANGIARAAPVMLRELAIGDISVRDVPAIVAERGAQRDSLLGMSFLSKLSRFEVARGKLYLRR